MLACHQAVDGDTHAPHVDWLGQVTFHRHLNALGWTESFRASFIVDAQYSAAVDHRCEIGDLSSIF